MDSDIEDFSEDYLFKRSLEDCNVSWIRRRPLNRLDEKNNRRKTRSNWVPPNIPTIILVLYFFFLWKAEAARLPAKFTDQTALPNLTDENIHPGLPRHASDDFYPGMPDVPVVTDSIADQQMVVKPTRPRRKLKRSGVSKRRLRPMRENDIVPLPNSFFPSRQTVPEEYAPPRRHLRDQHLEPTVALNHQQQQPQFEPAGANQHQGGADYASNFDNFFSYGHMPNDKEYEFGFKRGSPHFFIERYQKGGPGPEQFKAKVRWGDDHGSYAEHYWDYNHTEAPAAPADDGKAAEDGGEEGAEEEAEDDAGATGGNKGKPKAGGGGGKGKNKG